MEQQKKIYNFNYETTTIWLKLDKIVFMVSKYYNKINRNVQSKKKIRKYFMRYY